MSDHPTCATCAYFVREACRRWPPLSHPNPREDYARTGESSWSQFPPVLSELWCGEHKPKDPELPEGRGGQPA